MPPVAGGATRILDLARHRVNHSLSTGQTETESNTDTDMATTTLPLVRVAAAFPFMIWLRDNGRPLDLLLREAGLPPTLVGDPDQPIPLQVGIEFLRSVAHAEGPDIGCRVVEHAGVDQIGLIGELVRASRTPREAFHLVARAFFHHGSHEVFTFTPHAGGATVRHVFRVPLDDEALFITQQFVASLIASVVTRDGKDRPALERVELTPHPVLGLSLLEPHFSCAVSPTLTGAVAVTFSDQALDEPYAQSRIPLAQQVTEGCGVIRGDGTLAGSIRAVLPLLLARGGEPTLAEVARFAFMSPRTLQRRLTAEGTSLSRLIEQERAARAIALLTASTNRVQEVATEMGYGSGASFTRAVRRWTSAPPTRLRKSRIGTR
ncbi:helix-turn-helix- domain containing protein AraC type [Xanthobacter versatilis]|uniref:Helix-turn-helix-domain containing protein AraC type n=1 Tax=Xanthobacter autotrophicus (strain ATCC BAA-1158 / Py2) TaxID=78245 RepID=A7IJH1_XANP2|nr:helix-turn-helix- domain containing protein AraC type [Xanthobacter autotrophicus Py2]